MTLNKLYKEQFKKVPMIGIYEGPNKQIYPEYADEILETHGDLEVKDYCFSEKHNVLVVEF